MAAFYTDENFPLGAVQSLRLFGHDVLTAREAGQDNQAIPDATVLDFASQKNRALLTHNRRDFIRLHLAGIKHAGIVVCTVDADVTALARRIHDQVSTHSDLHETLLRINRGP